MAINGKIIEESVYCEERNFKIHKRSIMNENITNTQWVVALAYLLDIFESSNIVNLLLQERQSICRCKYKVAILVAKKLDLIEDSTL